MNKSTNKSYLRSNELIKLSISIFLIAIITNQIMGINEPNQTYIYNSDHDKIIEDIEETPNIAAIADVLFQGVEQPLNITDYGYLYKNNEEISISNETEYNLTYYLDDTHDWKVTEIETKLNNIEDTREWVNNSAFLPILTYRVNQTIESNHNYGNNRVKANSLQTIVQTGATAVRFHIVNITFEPNLDFLIIEDVNNVIYYMDTYVRDNFFSPWIPGNTAQIYIESDLNTDYYGYYIDYYEFLNSSSNSTINLDSWGYNEKSDVQSNYGSGDIGNASASYVAIYPDLIYDGSSYDAEYKARNYVEFYQNLSIPRGEITNAYLSFDFFPQYCITSNEFSFYFAINQQVVFYKGFSDLVNLGLDQWHPSGRINIDLWSNTSNVFENPVSSQNLNFSIGILHVSTSNITYGGYLNRFQQVVWFDNVSLEISSISNSTQEDIDLKFNGFNLIDGSTWGFSALNLTSHWDTDPVIITLTTNSPSLTFILNSTLHGYHNATSRINQQNTAGVSYKILKNGTIIWEFLHNLYMPAQYEGFEFIINKPSCWEILQVLDPTLEKRKIEGGGYGDTFIKINTSEAIFPGWWSFMANSPNYINNSNTKMYKDGQWVHTSFTSGETTMIKTQVNYSNDVPSGVETFPTNLTIYNPSGDVWYEESMNPEINGTVTFSQIEFSSANTTGGIYNYTLLWSNGTALGGLNASFTLIHNSSLTLLKPDDAISDFITDAFVGDLIPLRINFKDSENYQSISNALISYNWTDGNRNITESALGIYEVVLYTSDLVTNGLYEIFIQASIPGFENSNFTLTINLGEKTILQVLGSEYTIEMHANSSLQFKYYTELGGQGINFSHGCVLSINITNPSYYWIQNTGDGIYDIQFNTSYIDSLGTHKIEFNFTAPSFETQSYTHQFNIIKQPVNLTIQYSYNTIEENDIVQANFNDNLILSIRAMSIHDSEFIGGGNITFISQKYEENLTENGNYWFNASILCSSSKFSFGINSIYLKFEHSNYSIKYFAFQLIVNQIDINVEAVNYEGNVKGFVGEIITIKIALKDSNTKGAIMGASVSFVWDYGVGSLIDNGDGTYEVDLDIPDNTEGTHELTIIITKEGAEYKAREFGVIISVSIREIPSYFMWIIIAILLAASAIFGLMSYRSYVILPKRRRKHSELLASTQRFKDIKNIQAIVLVQNLSGVPLYFKNYGHFEERDKELFSGFIQAITTLGEEFSRRDTDTYKIDKESKLFGEDILELNFKYFHTLISDYQHLRIVMILKNKCSERLKKQINLLSATITSQLGEEISNFQGAIDVFEEKVPPILNNFLGLHFKDEFKLASKEGSYYIKLNKLSVTNPLEFKVMKTIEKQTEEKENFLLESILDWIRDDDENLIIKTIESLIQKELIIPIK